MTSVARAVWVRLPIAAGSISRTLAVVLSDGAYLTRWPLAALLGPPIAVLYGIALSQTRSPDQLTYTYAFLPFFVVVVIAGFSAALGLYLTIAYALCDFFLFDHTSQLVTLRPALLVSYLLLALLAVLTPLSARLVRRRSLPDPARLGALGRPLDLLLAAVTFGGLVFLWTESSAVLIRPVFVWTELGSPTDQAIHPLQQFGWILALVAAAVGAARAELETRAGPAVAVEIGRGLRARPSWRPPALVSAGVDGLVLTFLLGGLLDSWLEVPLVFGAVAAISFARRVGPAAVPAWPRLLSPIPMILRLALGIVLTALAGQAIVTSQFDTTSSLWPVAAATVVGVLVMAALLPDLAAAARSQRRSEG
jgi:hypothetical protein